MVSVAFPVGKRPIEAVIGFAFDDLQLHRIMANYQPNNLRSEALLEYGMLLGTPWIPPETLAKISEERDALAGEDQP